MAAIPGDVLVDIFCRLPVKTLLRFRCVTKQFLSIIDDPDFIKRHLQYQSLNHQKLIFECGNLDKKLVFLDLDVLDNYVNLEYPCENFGWNRDLECDPRVDDDEEEEDDSGFCCCQRKFRDKGNRIVVNGYCDGLLAVTSLMMKLI